MFKDIFNNARHIAFYPLFSLLVFFAFFVAVTIWVVGVNKKHVEEMSRLPLDEKESETPHMRD